MEARRIGLFAPKAIRASLAALIEHAGHRVMPARSAFAARGLLVRATPPDAFVLGLWPRDEDGWTVLEVVGRDRLAWSVPVVVVTPLVVEDEGADELRVVRWPIDGRLLDAVLARVVGAGRAAARASALRYQRA